MFLYPLLDFLSSFARPGWLGMVDILYIFVRHARHILTFFGLRNETRFVEEIAYCRLADIVCHDFILYGYTGVYIV